MKQRFAKRSASEYQQSLSSHQSCKDSIIARIELQSSLSLSSQKQNQSILANCNIDKTPAKRLNVNNKTHSMEKMDQFNISIGKLPNQDFQDQTRYWQFQSEDSKLRKKNDYYSQSQKNYKQHVKALKFQDQNLECNLDKQNQPLHTAAQQSSSDGENQDIRKTRKLQKRKVGALLYDGELSHKRSHYPLTNILQEQLSHDL